MNEHNNPFVHDLQTVTSGNLKGRKEFNHLRVNNINDFFKSYTNNLDYYATPFKILYDLETKVKYENRPEDTILIPYKDEGDVIFDLVAIIEENGLRIVEYQFQSYIS